MQNEPMMVSLSGNFYMKSLVTKCTTRREVYQNGLLPGTS